LTCEYAQVYDARSSIIRESFVVGTLAPRKQFVFHKCFSASSQYRL